jgi:hypothetical protein
MSKLSDPMKTLESASDFMASSTLLKVDEQARSLAKNGALVCAQITTL